MIPAAGLGSRFGDGVVKQYAQLGDGSVLEHSAQELLDNPEVAKVMVVLSASDAIARGLPVMQHEKIMFTVGGAERSHSVLNGLLALQSLASADDWVLVHDAARPCLSAADLQKLIEQLRDDPVGGILAVPAVDTLKHVSAARIEHTVDRANMWQAQTPQMFRYGLLCHAMQYMQEQEIAITDEASAMELCGYVAKVIEGSRSNIKITYPQDLALACFYREQST